MDQQLNQIIEILKDISISLNSFDPQWILVILACINVLLFGIYLFFTKRILQSSEENLRPIVSCNLISGKEYYKERLKQNSALEPILKYDTRCVVRNHSKYNLEVYVNLNLKLDGIPVEYSDAYSGKKAWPVTSFQSINGHFDLKKHILEETENITISLEVKYNSDVKKTYKNPIQNWIFDKEKGEWVNSIGLAV